MTFLAKAAYFLYRNPTRGFSEFALVDAVNDGEEEKRKKRKIIFT